MPSVDDAAEIWVEIDVPPAVKSLEMPNNAVLNSKLAFSPSKSRPCEERPGNPSQTSKNGRFRLPSDLRLVQGKRDDERKVIAVNRDWQIVMPSE